MCLPPGSTGRPCGPRHRRASSRANPEINFRNGGSAEGSLARRGGKPIPRRGGIFLPPRLGLPTQHSQRPLAAPALSQAILSEVLGRRPGRNGLSAVSEAQGQGLRTLAFASSCQTGHCASAIWKFLSGFALSARAGDRLLKVARTIADLAGSQDIRLRISLKQSNTGRRTICGIEQAAEHHEPHRGSQ